jgi:hypothetical protein
MKGEDRANCRSIGSEMLRDKHNIFDKNDAILLNSGKHPLSGVEPNPLFADLGWSGSRKILDCPGKNPEQLQSGKIDPGRRTGRSLPEGSLRRSPPGEESPNSAGQCAG